MNKIPVGKILVAALALPWQLRQRLAIALSIPAAMFLILDIVSAYSEGSSLLSFVLYVIHLFAYAIFGVACHRLFLLGADATPARIGMVWSEREANFIRWIIVLWFPGLLMVAVASARASTPAMPSGALANMFIAIYFLQLYIWARCAIILPAIALDRVVDLSWAWNLSHGNVARLVILLGVIPALLSFNFASQDSIVITAIESVVHTMLLTIEIAILSLVYSYLTPQGPYPQNVTAA